MNTSVHNLVSVNDTILNLILSILYNVMFWRLHRFVSYISYYQWQSMISVIAVGYLFWTATRETSRTYERARGLSGTDAQSVHVTNTRGIRREISVLLTLLRYFEAGFFRVQRRREWRYIFIVMKGAICRLAFR